jgi:L-threonylcarbamoyladenylate synthase
MQVINLKQLNAVSKTIETLKQGNLIIYPTETCYGLGADITNQTAIDKLLRFKTRREGKAFSVAVFDQAMAQQYVKLNDTAKNLYQNFLPGPLTIVSKVKDKLLAHHSFNASKSMAKLASGVTSEFDTLGIRIPDYPFVIELVKQFGKPITSTSANISYQSPPYSLHQWQKQTPKKSQKLIDLWIDAGQLPHRQPSTVIDTTADELTVLRQGSIKINRADLEVTTRSETETYELAKKILTSYFLLPTTCFIIALQGPLGAGKTQFAKGIAQALGIKQTITSPTFTLVHEYRIPINSYKLKAKSYLYHIDTWRMEKPEELIQIEFKNMLQPGNLILIEWAEKVQKIINKTTRQQNNKIKILWGDIKIIDFTTRLFRFSQTST